MIHTVQTAFGSIALPAASFELLLTNPTSVGNVLSVYLKFGPLTGTPNISDNFGNRYRPTAFSTGSAEAVGIWTVDLQRAGANHVVTAAAQGGLQTMEMAVTELSVLDLEPGERAESNDILYAILIQSFKQTALLERLATAERA